VDPISSGCLLIYVTFTVNEGEVYSFFYRVDVDVGFYEPVFAVSQLGLIYYSVDGPKDAKDNDKGCQNLFL
jgi:hypothetical protein